MMKISRKMEDVEVQNTVHTSALQDLKKPFSIGPDRMQVIFEHGKVSFEAFGPFP